MGQKPNKPSSWGREHLYDTGGRRRAWPTPPAMATPLEPIPSAAGAVSGPFHDEGPPKLDRHNPALTLSVLGGMIAIIMLVVGMLFAGTSFDEDDVRMPQTMYFEAGR